ncbi:hypothetical protein LXL04_033097 [Taraxacum kok-saghyz]
MTIFAGISHRCICNRVLCLVIRHLHRRQHQSTPEYGSTPELVTGVYNPFGDVMMTEVLETGRRGRLRRRRENRRRRWDADHRRCEKHPCTHVLDGGSGQKGHMRTVLKNLWNFPKLTIQLEFLNFKIPTITPESLSPSKDPP